MTAEFQPKQSAATHPEPRCAQRPGSATTIQEPTCGRVAGCSGPAISGHAAGSFAVCVGVWLWTLLQMQGAFHLLASLSAHAALVIEVVA